MKYLLYILPLLLLACRPADAGVSTSSVVVDEVIIDSAPAPAPMTHWDTLMLNRGLVDVTTLGLSNVTIDLRYATDDNFAGHNMYGDFNKAYLHKDAAESLRKALAILQADDPKWGVIIYDAARPLSVQRVMFDVVKGTTRQKYVAPPNGGGPHNYGIALDIGLTYDGQPVDMGTPFDTFNETAHITAEPLLVKQGEITREAMDHRVMLRRAMTQAGFRTYSREWWHFTRYTSKYARSRLKILDF